MGQVYVFREAGTNYFKVGRTAAVELSGTEARLRTGNPRKLLLFRSFEVADESGCEAMFHRLLGDRRVRLGGGTEFFAVPPCEMEFRVEQIESTFRLLAASRAHVGELKDAFDAKGVSASQAKDVVLRDQLLALRQERAALDLQIELIELRLKERIGRCEELEGLASWKVQNRRCYSEALFRERDRAGFEEVLERFHCVDTGRWKREDAEGYRRVQTRHYVMQRARRFVLAG